MGYSTKVLADSIAEHGARLTTLEVTFPRIILAEVNTHRKLSRNSGSSRAIPSKKIFKRIKEDPFVPSYWGANQPGMQADNSVSGWRRWMAKKAWIFASTVMLWFANFLLWLGVHKQLTNRLLEPWMWQTAIISATEWGNLFGLRCHPAAQPEFQTIALMMQCALAESVPKRLRHGDWHLPLMPDLEELKKVYNIDDLVKISVGRCCRVSYLTHDGVRDPQKDIELCDKLIADGHMSPLEHVATPSLTPISYGNFTGWRQARWFIPHEDDFSAR